MRLHAALAMGLTLGWGAPFARAQTIVDLGLLPGGTTLQPAAVNGDGSVVAGQADANGVTSLRPFRWTLGGGVEQLPLAPSDEWGFAAAVSTDGTKVVGVGFIPGGGQEMLQWTAAGLESLSFGARAMGTSYNGAVIVGECQANLGFWADSTIPLCLQEASYWTRQGGLGPLPGGLGPYPMTTSTYGTGQICLGHLFLNFWPLYATGVSEDGLVACGVGTYVGGPWGATAYSAAPAEHHCFVWRNAVAYPLGELAGHNFSEAMAVSGDGSTVVGFSMLLSGGGERAFRWTLAGGMEDIGAGRALAVNRDGSVIVGQYAGGAFLWTRAIGAVNLQDWLQARSVNLNGWQLKEATAINSDGRVMVGRWSGGPFSPGRGWRLLLPCPPDSFACRADFDCSGALSVADVFAYLNAWFAGEQRCDFDGLNGLQVADIFAFLNAWFAGC